MIGQIFLFFLIIFSCVQAESARFGNLLGGVAVQHYGAELPESQWINIRQELGIPSLKDKHIILMGPSGAGKGTLSQFLKTQGNYYHFSLGEAIRQEIANETPIGLACKEDLAVGNLVPKEIGFALFDQHFQAAVKNNQHFIIDGMIQSQDYVDFFDHYIAENGLSERFCYVYLKLDENSARHRIAHRVVCPSCGQTYSQGIQQCEQCRKHPL